jgi:hypothetical protein
MFARYEDGGGRRFGWEFGGWEKSDGITKARPRFRLFSTAPAVEPSPVEAEGLCVFR